MAWGNALGMISFGLILAALFAFNADHGAGIALL